MIHNLLLIAAREFRQIAATRSFWLTLLILPLALAAAPLASRFFADKEGQSIIMIDQTGGDVAKAIKRRIEQNEQRAVMVALARHTERRNIRFTSPQPEWSLRKGWYDDSAVDRFVAEGGLKTALAVIKKASKDGADGFDPPVIGYRVVSPPPELAAQTPQSIAKAVETYLRPAPESNAKPVDYILFIPASFGKSPQVSLWANGQPRSFLVSMIETELGKNLRTGYLVANGTSAQVAGQVDLIAPAIAITTPPQGKGRERLAIRSALPLACSIILIMALMLSGSWMLQTTVEERGNKLIETVLACVSPNELMYGKLAGTVAIGLTMIATWVACGLFVAFATHGEIAELIRPALEPVSSLSSIATILYFFIAGYVMISMIFLVLGVMSDSMQEAKAFLNPILFLIMIPFSFLAPAVLAGTKSVALTVMTWVPLYSPFTILARLGGGLPAWEVIGSGVLLLAFIVGEVILLGRVFRACLLNSGRRPSLKAVFQMMRSPG